MDVTLTKVRIGLFWDDKKLTQQSITDAHAELKKGGDWERKNKLKVYEGEHNFMVLFYGGLNSPTSFNMCIIENLTSGSESSATACCECCFHGLQYVKAFFYNHIQSLTGLFKITTQDFSGAATLLLDSVATFTATELVSFSDFIFYAVLMSLVGLPRKTLKDKVIKSPEILSAIHETPHMKDYLLSFYNCEYAKFMQEFVHVIDIIKADRYMSAHTIKLTRQMRLNVYTQFITSYKSVTLSSMADTFGVSPQFIDKEIYGFISSGKLLCKIDKVNGVIETAFENQHTKSKAYMDIIKEGDNLLNKMQKLASAIDR